MLLSNTVYIRVRYLSVSNFEIKKKSLQVTKTPYYSIFNITLERNILINLLICISDMILDLYTYSSNMDTGFQPSPDFSYLKFYMIFFLFYHSEFYEIHYHIIIVYISLNCLLMIIFFHFFIWVLKTSKSFLIYINIYIPENLGRFLTTH